MLSFVLLPAIAVNIFPLKGKTEIESVFIDLCSYSFFKISKNITEFWHPN